MAGKCEGFGATRGNQGLFLAVYAGVILGVSQGIICGVRDATQISCMQDKGLKL